MSDLVIQRYKAHPEEVLALRKLVRKWSKPEPGSETTRSWDFDQTLATLAIKGSGLIYVRRSVEGEDELTPQNWIGAMIYQQVFERTDLLFIYVIPEERRKNLAQQMLDEMLRELKAAGQTTDVFLEVAVDNAPAIAFYKKAGFQDVAHREKYYRDGRDAMVMRLTVA